MHVQSCPILCNPTDCGAPGSSVHGIFQANSLPLSHLVLRRTCRLTQKLMEGGEVKKIVAGQCWAKFLCVLNHSVMSDSLQPQGL